jgi:Domain of unknown function (DUF4157)
MAGLGASMSNIQTHKATPITTATPGVILQRKCSCGSTPGPTGECENCRKKREAKEQTVQRVAVDSSPVNEVPQIVHEVLQSPGQPLDRETRNFMEPRFGYDFSSVRVHTNNRATESARAVNALAYTVGQNVVFARGHYSPHAPVGRHLLAHELAHVVQQRNQGTSLQPFLSVASDNDASETQAKQIADAVTHDLRVPSPTTTSSTLQRACLSASDCGKVEGSLSNFVAETENKPENKSKAEQRRLACGKVPPDPKCIGDGHGTEARQLMALLKDRLTERTGFIQGIFIDKDIPADYGAYTNLCSSFTPPKNFPGKYCTFVPETLENEAKQFNTTENPTIGGQNRQTWLTEALRRLTHETEHAHFDAAPPIAKPSPTACDFSTISDNLTELAAITSEFKVVYKRILAKPAGQRKLELDSWFKFWVTSPGESISGTVKAVRCACECKDADEYIKKTVGFVTAGWNSVELDTFHTELRNPKWKLNWPIEPPPSVNVEDLPSAYPQVDVRDLPKTK